MFLARARVVPPVASKVSSPSRGVAPWVKDYITPFAQRLPVTFRENDDRESRIAPGAKGVPAVTLFLPLVCLARSQHPVYLWIYSVVVAFQRLGYFEWAFLHNIELCAASGPFAIAHPITDIM